MGVYITNLLLMKRYDQAESLIRSSEVTVSNKYYQAQLLIFNGILYEKKYMDINQAQSFYKKGIAEILKHNPEIAKIPANPSKKLGWCFEIDRKIWWILVW